jgi:hypothetical protein
MHGCMHLKNYAAVDLSRLSVPSTRPGRILKAIPTLRSRRCDHATMFCDAMIAWPTDLSNGIGEDLQLVYCTPQLDIYTLAALVLPKDKGSKNQKSVLHIHNHHLTDNISDHVLLLGAC